jgi:double-stranded uracil-DNA glycosylase
LKTLDDLLKRNLDVIFVGINPSIYSDRRGHYFARPGNRFWPCLSRSELSLSARKALHTEILTPQHDRALLKFGIGFTDLVKRPTAKASDLSSKELAGGVDALVDKLKKFKPRIACFHGITGYRHVHDLLADKSIVVKHGFQPLRLGDTRIFLAPNPSGANAHFTRDDQVRAYDEIAAWLSSASPLPRPSSSSRRRLRR